MLNSMRCCLFLFLLRGVLESELFEVICELIFFESDCLYGSL
jgi:hypothetical protein